MSNTFKSNTTWGGALACHNTVNADSFVLDEPKALGGADSGINMVEYVLATLGSTLAAELANAAATKGGIELDRVTVDAEGDLDLHTFLGLQPGGNAGFERVTVKVTTTPSRPELAAVLEDVWAANRTASLLKAEVTVKNEFRATSKSEAEAEEVKPTVPIESITGLVGKVKEDPAAAATVWKATATWSGDSSKVINTVRGHVLPLNGETDPYPYIGAAYGSCLTVGIVLNSVVRGHPIHDVAIGVDVVSDDKGGTASIVSHVNLQADATTAELEALFDHVMGTSPVGNIFTRAIETTAVLVVE